MQKNIIIGILGVVAVVSLAFGYYQNVRAARFEIQVIANERLATELKKEVERQKKIADEQRMLAEANAAEARRQQLAAEQALQKRK